MAAPKIDSLWEDLEPKLTSVAHNLDLAEEGKRVIKWTTEGMPGLKKLLLEYESQQPLAGVRITVTLNTAMATAVLVDTLVKLGAKVRWASCATISVQDDIAAAVAKYYGDSVLSFATKCATREEFAYFIYQAFAWPDGEAPHLLVDCGCVGYDFLHLGYMLEKQYEKTGKLYDPNDFDPSDRDLIACVHLLNHVVPKKPGFFQNIASTCYGSSEQTSSGITKYRKIMNKHGLLFPVFSTNDSITKHKYDNVYGCRQSCIHGIVNGTELFLIGGMTTVVIGYGNVGKGVVQAFRGMGSKVVVTESDPICALQAAMEGVPVVLLEDVIGVADFFITTTGGINCISVEDMKKMKDNAVVGNIGMWDQEINMSALENYPGIIVEPVKAHTEKFIFPETGRGVIVLSRGRLYNLGNGTGLPPFVMSASFASQALCLLTLQKNKETKEYGNSIHKLPKLLDEKIARYHHEALGIKLTKLTQDQCDFLGIPSPEGPFKPDDYHY